MLTCKEFDQFIVDFLDKNLPLRKRLSMHLHLMMCKGCPQYLADYRRAIELGQTVCGQDDEEVADDVPEELIKAVLANLDKK